MPETALRPETPSRQRWDGLGNHGFVYLDSFGDTGVTLVPRVSRLHGSTGTWGDPRWETLDVDETYCIFFVEPRTAELISALDRKVAWWQDVVTITPVREKVRRAELRAPVEPAQVALEDVLSTLREQAGLPVGDLAAMLGVSRRQFYNWMARKNGPDLEHDQRVRHTATLVERLHANYGEARLARAALLASTVHGNAFDAFRVGDLGLAEQAIDAILAGSPLIESPAPSVGLPFDREHVLTELEHLRDAPRLGDG